MKPPFTHYWRPHSYVDADVGDVREALRVEAPEPPEPADGEADPKEDPEIAAARREVIGALLRWLVNDNSDPATIGRKALLTAWLCNAMPTVTSQRQLAEALKLSPGRTSELLQSIRAQLSLLAE